MEATVKGSSFREDPKLETPRIRRNPSQNLEKIVLYMPQGGALLERLSGKKEERK